MEMQKRAKKGGEMGSNGFWYDGGKFLPSTGLRVAELGRGIGIANLSAHDCRHYWATAAARGGTDPLALQQAGGWNSLTMVRRYVEESTIANDGVKLP